MPSIKKNDIENTLESKFGFVREDSDHRKFVLYRGGKPVARTLTSQGRNVALDAGMVARMAKQIKITANQLKQSVECCFSFQDYLSVLKSKGYL